MGLEKPEYLSKLAHLATATALFCFMAPASACDTYPVDCFYFDGHFLPFTINFSTETSVAGLAVNVGVSQQLQQQRRDDTWSFETKITGFVYGLYGSIIDSSDFTILPDNSYQTRDYARKAHLYGIIPLRSTSFRQKFKWADDGVGEVESHYKDKWYEYNIEPGTLDQGLILLQLRSDLIHNGPDIGTKVYTATSKKHIDDDFMFRFVTEAELQTPMGNVATAVYELLKGEHKKNLHAADSTRDLGEIEQLVEQLITLRQTDPGKQRDIDIRTAEDQLNRLLRVDTTTIVSIAEEDAKASGKSLPGKIDDSSIVSQASEIEEGNARVFIWFSRAHAYLPVKLLAVIDSKTWTRMLISGVSLDSGELSSLVM